MMAIISLKQQATIFRMALLSLTVLLLWGEVRQVEAGCQRFGHSCFGAHGKRAEIPAGLELPSSDGFNYNNQPSRPEYDSPPLTYQQLNRMSPYLVDWITSMHRGEQRQPFQIPRDDLPLAERRRK